MDFRSKIINTSAIAALGFGLTATMAAHAQDEAPAEEENSLSLATVTVTAQKREENIQDVPAAVSVFSGAQLEAQRVDSTEDLVSLIPTFNVNASQFSSVSPALRGSNSNNTSPGGDQSVALFVDEIYFGGSTDWNPDLFDVERIEVLRGPQGTLFGRNVVGGALNVVTKKPSQTLEGKLRATIGNFERLELDGYVSGPITDTLSASLAVSSKSTEGMLEGRFLGRRVEGIDKQSVRAKLLYAPNEDFEWNLGFSYSKDNSTGPLKDFLSPPITGIPEFANFVPDTDPDTVDSPFEGGTNFESYMFNSKATWDFDWGSIVSVTGYREQDADLMDVDILGAPFRNALDAEDDNSGDQFSQEFRIVSPNGSKLEYTAGVYYFVSNSFEDEGIQFTLYPGTLFFTLENIYRSLEATTDALTDTHTTFTQRQMDIKTESYAVFGQASYDLTDQLRATVGARYTWDDKSGYSQSTGDSNFIFPLYPRTPLDGSWEAFTPRIALDYKVTDDVLIYASAARGFKSGSFTYGTSGFGPLAVVANNASNTAAVPLDAEFVDSYEVGLKSTFLNGRGLFNVAVFQADYEGQQNAFVEPNGNVATVNLGDLTVKGIEFDGAFALLDNLDVGFNYAYTDSEVDESDPDFGGNKAALTPENAGSIWATLTQDLGEAGELRWSANATFKSEYFTEISNDAPFATQNDGTVNARVEYTPDGKPWTFALWGKNLTDERFLLYSNDLGGFFFPGGDPRLAQVVSPRWSTPQTYGMSVIVEF